MGAIIVRSLIKNVVQTHSISGIMRAHLTKGFSRGRYTF
jgi:hypothetical protein